MRRNATIEEIWSSGNYRGDRRPDTRITVDRDWLLRPERAGGSAMLDRRQPVRWYQDLDQTQNVTEIPTEILTKVDINRQLNSDAASLRVTLMNASSNGPLRRAQGMYSPRRSFEQRNPGGDITVRLVAQAEAEWGSGSDRPEEERMEAGDWSAIHTHVGPEGGIAHSYGRLSAGNMLRVYQGYGGADKTLEEALDDGNLVPTGVFIIDDITVGAKGSIELACRDVAGLLLVDQVLYPPLVPIGCYPTQFFSKNWNLATTGDPRGRVPTSTNYRDLSDIVRLLVLWSGFWLKGSAQTNQGRFPGVYGAIEDTGIASEAVIGAQVFDKKKVIDAIHEIRKIVNFIVWIDQEGGFRFNSPNIWEAGNFDYDGNHQDFAFSHHEMVNLLDFSATTTMKVDRSSITMAAADPYRNGPGTTKIAAFNTNTANVKNQLHGASVPAMFGLDSKHVDIPLTEMITWSELTGLRIWMLRRAGAAHAPANPLIDIDDQVKIVEQTTGDMYLHRVESLATSHDLNKGAYTMDIGSHWMGSDNDSWAIRIGPGGHVVYNSNPSQGGTVGRTQRRGRIVQPRRVPTLAEARLS